MSSIDQRDTLFGATRLEGWRSYWRAVTYPRIPPDARIDRTAHERACTDQTWHYLESPPWNDPEVRGAKWPISIDLDGSYPDTNVVVTMGYLHRPSPRQHRYPIWKSFTDHGLPDDGSIPTPELFGVNVALWIMES